MHTHDDSINPSTPMRGTTGAQTLSDTRQSIDQNAQVQLPYSISVVMPAHNEEQVIADTVKSVCTTLAGWTQNFEVIVVNDGSIDRTGAILVKLTLVEPRLRVIIHSANKGYGAALISGFAAARKELVFFMDSDGQFDIQDMSAFFPYLAEYDAVLGYRIQRQDTWVRKLNAWGWKQVVRVALGVHVRDLDCAFKLYRAEFLRRHDFETQGAMINAEMLYKFTRDGYTFKEVGVHHLPRKGGQATGANPRVVLRAFRELFAYARRWRREELQTAQTAQHI